LSHIREDFAGGEALIFCRNLGVKISKNIRQHLFFIGGFLLLQFTRAKAVDGAKLRARCAKDHYVGDELMKRCAQIIDSGFDAASEHLVELGQSTVTRVDNSLW